MLSTSASSRVLVYDVLRGWAVLGILVANIGAFSGPFSDHLKGHYLPIESNPALNLAVIAFVVGKFRTMLAVLFGAGLWLQYQKRKHSPSLWPRGYLKRTFWLLVIGLVHAISIWYGDILVQYAMIAFVAVFFVHFDQQRMLQTILGLIMMNLLCGIALSAIALNFPESYSLGGSAVYATGTYVDQLGDRLQFLAQSLLQDVLGIPFLLPLFLLGILLAQTGALVAPSKRPKIRNVCLGLGLGLGLPLNLTIFLLGDPKFVPFWEYLVGPLLGVGYVMAGAVIVERRGLGTTLRLVSQVGKLALTTYLMQSILCTSLFYSWGGGQFGGLDALQLLGVVALVWVINLVFAVVWLRFFSIGPIEWVWRSLTESTVLPIRNIVKIT